MTDKQTWDMKAIEALKRDRDVDAVARGSKSAVERFLEIMI